MVKRGQQSHHSHHTHRDHSNHATHHATHHTPAPTHSHTTMSSYPHAGHIEDKLIHNMIELQKVHAEMAEKFTKLSNQLSALLTLFEMTARSFAQQAHAPTIEKDKEFLDKIDKLLDQNKTIAKGLTLMDEKMRERLYGPSQSQTQAPALPRPMPSLPSFDAPRPLPKL